MKEATKEEFQKYLASFQNLHRSVIHFTLPPTITYSDPSRGTGLEALVATECEVWDINYKPTGRVEYQIEETV